MKKDSSFNFQGQNSRKPQEIRKRGQEKARPFQKSAKMYAFTQKVILIDFYFVLFSCKM